jgi:very-short-patch-repair endonuclease
MQHLTPEGQSHDRIRSEYLNQHGMRVLRFGNREVLLETEAVLQMIWDALETPSP